MAYLHPLECWLLENYSSPEHFAATRDAIIAFIDAHEAAFERYQKAPSLRGRSEPLWQQADIVWGSRVLPNIRPGRERYIQACILRSHNDPNAFNIGHAMSNYNKGITEFWNGWMTEEEVARISTAGYLATRLDQQLTQTINGSWREGGLTYLGQNGLYKLSELPARIPRYKLDPSVRIEIGEYPKHTGIYLPDADRAPARLLYPGADNGHPSPSAFQGQERKDWVNPDTGKRIYNWKTTNYIDSGWTLVRRVEGEYIDVPPEGFFPQKNPEELYTWPAREKDFLSHEGEHLHVWSGDAAQYTGEWAAFSRGRMEHIAVKQHEVLPFLTGERDEQVRACWTLIKRADGGSVLINGNP